MSIHEMSLVEVRSRLATGELSSEEVVRALHARIDALDGRLGCFVHRDPERVLAEAREADQERAAGKVRGPLHGLPLSIKESVDVAGTDATLGLRSRQGKPATSDAVLVQSLRDAGAILLGKTNVPQLLLAQETENVLFGVTRNPWNLDRVPGGSSGGEAAAIAAGLSLAGIGTDIGGSIRMPAHFCGIAGFKPTLDRWSNRGSNSGVPGQELVRAQIGALARTAEDLAFLFGALSPEAQARLDPAVPPLPAPDPSTVSLHGLRVGWFDDDGYLTPTRSVRRAVRAARDALADAGAELVPYHADAAQELIYLWLGAISADGGTTIDRQLAGEPISPQLKPSRAMLKIPGPVRRGLSAALGLAGERRLARLVDVLGEKRVPALWRLTARRTEMRRQELDAWRDARLDAVLAPPHSVPAMAHRASSDFTLSLSYSFRWTLLDFPAGIVPVTRVAPDETEESFDHKPDRVEKKLARIAAGSAGLPVGVQVVAPPYREDVALAIMTSLEARLRDTDGFPQTPIDPI